MAFRFDYEPGTIRYGEGVASALEEELAALDAERALVVTGKTVGTTSAVIDPVRDGIGDRLVGTFAETTPDKLIGTALAGANRIREDDVDALVALGAGSSIDLAKVMTVIAASGRPDDEIREEFETTGTISIPDGTLIPVAAVPTTLAGADLSIAGGVTSRRDGLVRGGVSDPRLMPSVLCYDPELFRTTPHGVLCASAMNGFDKAVESPYAAAATPITDSTATRSLQLLSRGLPRLGNGERGDATMDDVIVGIVLAQYGCSRADGKTISLIHAFGHGIARGYAVQQGGAHGIIAPHALAYLFDNVDGRRDMLAEGLGVDDTSDPASAIVERIVEIRDALGLPSRLREVEDVDESDLPSIARDVADDSLLPNCPEGLDPTVDELEGVLRAAW